MNWQAEADALIGDIRSYVKKIYVSSNHESSDHQIYFNIETLDGTELIVSMEASGFLICERDQFQVSSSENGVERPMRVYETINSLLDDISPKYREAFASDLQRKIGSLEANTDTGDP